MAPDIDRSRCINCLVCVDICPYDVFKKVDGIAKVFSPQNCIECSECIRNCTSNAISL